MIALVSHDAGGAEILSSWIRKNKEPYYLVLKGPAITIFKSKLGNCKIHTLEEAIKFSDLVICGTSWQSDLERQAIILSKSLGKKVIAFLDHWVEFQGRFQMEEAFVFPNEIWVGDKDAEIIAKKIFPEIDIFLKPNPYLEDIKSEFKRMKKNFKRSKKYSVLYVTEPLREQALLQYGNDYHFGYTEEDALRFFLKNLYILRSDGIDEIKIRPHPSENKNKYNWVMQENSLVVETASNKTLLQQILEADLIVGCESMAMVVALIVGKRVISSIPQGGNICGLPQAGIEHLQLLIKKAKEI